MPDITYCVPYAPCPFTDCIRHYSHLEELVKKGTKYASAADFAPTCRRYIAHIVEVVENES